MQYLLTYDCAGQQAPHWKLSFLQLWTAQDHKATQM